MLSSHPNKLHVLYTVPPFSRIFTASDRQSTGTIALTVYQYSIHFLYR